MTPMTRLVLSLTLALITVIWRSADAGVALWPGLTAGPHRVGFRILDVVDAGRTVAPPADWQGNARQDDNFRHIRISIWYPANVKDRLESMRYRDYIEAAGFETPMEGKLLRGVDGYVAHSTFGGADVARLHQMVESTTTAYRDAAPLTGRFPVIVYAPSFSYESFENSTLFEYLASHGYIVAASRSEGPETREMSSDLAGVETSVRDMERILDALAGLEQSDLDKVGAAGFSWGGLSAALLGMRNHNVRAVLALDGSLEHAEMPAIEEQYNFRPRRLRGGYLAITGDREPARSMMGEALYTDVFEVRLPDLAHWDFASDFIRISVHSAAEQDPARRALVDESYAVIVHQARLFFDAYLKGAEAERWRMLEGYFGRDRKQVMIEVRAIRVALSPPPSPAEFAELLQTDVAEARAVLARFEKSDPRLELLDWTRLQDVITVSPFDTKLAILELLREKLGESSILFNNYGQAWRLEGDPEQALGCFRRALEINPDSGFARRSIEELEMELAGTEYTP